VIGSVGITLLGDYVSVLSIQLNISYLHIKRTLYGTSSSKAAKKAVKRKHGKPEVTVVYEKEADNIIA